MIIGIPGNLGDGKSATMCRLAMHYNSLCSKCNGIINDKEIIPILMYEPAKCICEEPSPYKIHANFFIYGIPDIHYVTTIEDVDKIYNGFAFLDEFWSWADSRASSHSATNLAVTGILHKSRKRGYNVVYESKLIHMTDRRVRELTDYILCPTKYINMDGELKKVQQHMLYPINMEQYFNDTWFVIDEVSGEGLHTVQEGLFQFKLSDVADRYNTKEEISNLSSIEATPGVEKGIKIETAFEKGLRDVGVDCKIIRGVHSRGWDVITDKFAFDVVSPRKDKSYPIIDMRKKNMKRLLEDATSRHLKPYFAFLNKKYGKWYVLPITEELIKKNSVSTKNATELSQLEGL